MTLGVGNWQFLLTDRTGAPFGECRQVTAATLTWERDDFGECRLRLAPGLKVDQALLDARTFRHEITAFRNGVQVWEGPITRIEFREDGIEIDAKDVSWYFTRRALEYGYDHTGTSVDAVEVAFNTLRQHYPATGDPYRIGQYLTKFVTPEDARTAAKVEAYGETVYDWLQNLVDKGGLDYLVRGREVIVLDTNTRVAQLPMMTQEHFYGGSPSIVEYGSELVTRSIVVRKDGTVVTKTAPQVWLDYYGNVDRVTNNNDDEDTAAADEAVTDQAERTLSDAYPAPVDILVPANVGVRSDAPFEFTDLYPGVFATIQISIHGKTATRLQRIDSLRVDWSQDGEEVQLTTVQGPADVVDAT
jgi:hypothetical protein